MSRILVCIPIKPGINPVLRRKCEFSAVQMSAANREHRIEVRFDSRPVEKLATDARPWSRVARARNRLLESVDLSAWDHLLWIDADVVSYPADLPTRLLKANPEGVTAPMVLVEGGKQFYDWAAFVEKGCDTIQPESRERIHPRNLRHEPPYWSHAPAETNVEMDCVGTITMVPTWIYKLGIRYEDHPAFTDHYPICKTCRDAGRKVVVCRDVIAQHADLPKYGEEWH
jgi:hypothetical protein